MVGVIKYCKRISINNNSADTLSALDGGGNDGILFYTSSTDTILNTSLSSLQQILAVGNGSTGLSSIAKGSDITNSVIHYLH